LLKNFQSIFKKINIKQDFLLDVFLNEKFGIGAELFARRGKGALQHIAKEMAQRSRISASSSALSRFFDR